MKKKIQKKNIQKKTTQNEAKPKSKSRPGRGQSRNKINIRGGFMIFSHILVLNFFSTLIPLLSQQPRDCPEENWDKYRENISNISKKYQEHLMFTFIKVPCIQYYIHTSIMQGVLVSSIKPRDK